ncbi:MAG: gliding motility-associated C-terminal domain-containing protein [Crocinitomicaceae bacterium]|nr:gliding motility-associated C-terminal domain-containing protein [Crocinitomicaceae bacterium]
MNIFRYTLMNRFYLLFLLLVSFSFQGNASHVLGGDITWKCQGGDYVFQLVFYRDCNGGIVNPANETIDVWGHPTLTSISLAFQSRIDISPLCTQVPGGPTPLDCGTGQGGGNGIGAIEKITYTSSPISISGIPPAEGWVFTYQNFARNGNIVNLIDPDQKGITLTSKMFAIPDAVGGCIDNSPQFLQDPYFVSCSGDPYSYNMNAVDPDLDSLHISFGTPLDHFPSQTYNPPTVPVELIYETGFSATSPTPGTTLNPGNIPAQINASSGELTFLSNTVGSYAVKIIARSYRNGVLIAEVDREIQLIVMNCSGTNSPPQITGPFGGLFETTINAGDLVNFTLNSTDVELLQDGSPQSNHLSASGFMFGTNFTSTGGCTTGPCATLNATPLITGVQGVSTTFNWQTDCDHLVTPFNGTEDMVPYHFVFKIQDDYCPVPKVTYATITINILNPGIILAPPINCIQSDATGDVTISWDQVANPDGSFNEYQIYTVENGLVGTVPAIGTTNFVDPGVGQEFHYYLAVAAGCDGNSLSFSDTISNIYLDVINPTNGTAVLQWNDPVNPALAGMNDFYHIYREFPLGTWTLYDSLPYGTNSYIDTITICDVFLNYQIVLPNQPCDYTSNIAGDQFEDMITPDIPIIDLVTIDTLTNGVTLTWNQNGQVDTYGYVIYTLNASGFIVEIDTVWGLLNTTYAHFPNTADGALTYSVAAFDSCFTISVPPTYQTSAKAPIHTSVYVSPNLDICAHEVNVNWTAYVGWDAIDHYEIFARWVGQPWANFGSTTGTSFNLSIEDGKDYCFTIKTISSTGQESFSNVACVFTSSPSQPSFNYLQVATVDGDRVILRQHIDNSVPITEMSIERKVGADPFEEIARIPVNSGTLTYIDEDVDVHSQSYSYRARVIDSCSNEGGVSNEAQTIFLEVQFDAVSKISYLNWNAYREFNGSIITYNVYRGIDGVFNGVPIVSLASHQLSYEDDMNAIISSGKICYYVEVIEATNTFGFNEISRSNEVCIVLPPLIYIPNAFMPDGINKIFRPILSDFDATDYNFVILNRWGQTLFKTNLYDEGWDGIVPATNREASAGTYVYIVSVKDANGVETLIHGHVTLIR